MSTTSDSETSIHTSTSGKTYSENTNLESNDAISSKAVDKEPKKAHPRAFPQVKMPKITSTDLAIKILKSYNLFKEVYTSDGNVDLRRESPDPLTSILVSGFGLRNLESLERAVAADEQRQLKKTESQEFPCVCEKYSTEYTLLPPPPSAESLHVEDRIKYLMSLEKLVGEEEYIPQERALLFPEIEGEFYEDFEPTDAIEIRKRYLKNHKVFEFFQFLLAHTISSSPENPIEYLLNLLDSILIYRTGMRNPPLLYEKKHIEQLFHLMDRFGTGSVDDQQYKTAMHTLGICSFNEEPKLTPNGMVSKETFVKEIFEAELAIFNDLIQNRSKCICPTMDRKEALQTIIDVDMMPYSESSEDTGEQSPSIKSTTKFYERADEKNTRVYKGKHDAELRKEMKKTDKVDTTLNDVLK